MAGAVPEIPGIKAPPYAAREIQAAVSRLLKRNSIGFPGAQPVSMVRDHLTNDLMKKDFFVCEKSDGLRCLMYLTDESGEEKIYLITRKNEIYFVPNLHVPLTDTNFGSYHAKGSLVDGELVRKDDNSLQFLMFDMIAVNGTVIAEKVLDKRLGYLEHSVFRPFVKLRKEFPEDTRVFPFTLVMKTMEFSYGLGKALHTHHGHFSDGLIFTSRTAPYLFGTDPNMIKWKPADENSVDFVLKLEFKLFTDPDSGEKWYDYDSIPETCRLLAWYGDDVDKNYSQLHLEPAEWEKLKKLGEPLDDRVIECYMDDQQRWRYLRFRDDKHHGNHIKVVENVIQSITDHVTEQDLMDSVDKIRETWQQRKKRQQGDASESDAKRQR